MRRWFMTVPEACSLVLKAGGVGRNGTIYALDMGEPVRIRDLAEQMIRFYGFEPETEIKIVYTGLRPGERLDEKRWADDEAPAETGYSRIFRLERTQPLSVDVAGLIEKLRPICRFDPANPDVYRNSELLRSILAEQFSGLVSAAP
jgi:FlaA1/EpsC-like NDP-sugar epimerase